MADPVSAARRLAAALVSALAVLPVLGAPPALAELPPWVYGAQQLQAPLVAALQILRVRPDAGGVSVTARVLAVRRRGGSAAAIASVQEGATLRLRLPPAQASSEGAPGVVGPAPLRPPAPGERLSAWLRPGPPGSGVWLPAAGGRSFGPSLEGVPDPAGR